MDCLVRMLPPGHAYRVTEPLNADFETNDVRPAGS